MAFSKSDPKSTKRALRGNKARGADDNVTVQAGLTVACAESISKAKQEINRQCRRIARVLHRHKVEEPKPAHSTITPEYTIPRIKFSSADLGLLATTTSDSKQNAVPSDALQGGFVRKVETSSPIPEVTMHPALSQAGQDVASTPSVSTNSGEIDSRSSTCSVYTSETASTVSSVTVQQSRVFEKPANLVAVSDDEHQAVQISHVDSPIVPSTGRIMSTTSSSDCMTALLEKKRTTPRQKVLKALKKLKVQLWSRDAAELNSESKITDEQAEKEGEEKPEKKTQEEAEHCPDRCQWEVIAKIESATIIDILRSALLKRHYGYRQAAMKVVSTAQGSYHQVFIAKTRNPISRKIEGWVVKIPGHGTPDRWTADDEYMLTQEVETMRLITTFTDVPAAMVVDYSASLDNKFGFPYIVMKELPGKSACELWYEDHAEIPSAETEQKRLNCLRSLARCMTELEKLRFDQIGMPMFNPFAKDFENYDDIEEERLPVGKYYVWPFFDTYRSVEHGPFPSTEAYTRNALKDLDDLCEDKTMRKNDETDDKSQHTVGTAKLLGIILSHPVFHSSPTSTFALRHSDLDLQNILIDDSGNVTGILDWDASLAMPRCVAHSSVPAFLDIDYYSDPLEISSFLCWRVSHYREVYAAAMMEAGNPDAQYTSKSHIYQAVLRALYAGENILENVLTRLLTEIRLQISLQDVKYLLTKRCKATEDMLKEKLWKVLDPEIPDEGVMQRVEQHIADAAVQEWTDGFTQFFSYSVEKA